MDRRSYHRRDDEDAPKKKGRNYLVSMLLAVIIIPLTHWISPGHIPISTGDIWSFHDTGLGDWLILGLPVFGWAICVNLAVLVYRRTKPDTDWLEKAMRGEEPTRGEMFRTGAIISLWAGVTEEIAFRWLIFLSSITSLAIGNWFLFDWAGFGVAEWFHLNAWGPIANWSTAGYLEPWIFDSRTWLVGGAMLTTNAFFRNGHKYQGIFGWVNSWFMGMFLFYVMLTHGLLAGIVIHVIYDLCCFWTAAVFAKESLR